MIPGSLPTVPLSALTSSAQSIPPILNVRRSMRKPRLLQSGAFTLRKIVMTAWLLDPPRGIRAALEDKDFVNIQCERG